MQTSSFQSAQSQYQDHTEPSRFLDGPTGFLGTHAIGAIARGLFLSAILWAALAITLYTIYTLIVGAH
jgi:hypothetical protein